MSEIDLEEKFPNLRPIRNLPSLGTVYGVGLSIYGCRDRDFETGTYIKTHVFTFAYLPLFAVGAYRVADAENGGLVIIGKDRLSTVAKLWNLLVTLFLCSGIGYGV